MGKLSFLKAAADTVIQTVSLSNPSVTIAGKVLEIDIEDGVEKLQTLVNDVFHGKFSPTDLLPTERIQPAKNVRKTEADIGAEPFSAQYIDTSWSNNAP